MTKIKHTFESLTKQKFGMLTVLNILEARYRKDAKLICDCDCGNKNVEISMGSVLEGTSKSCGCESVKAQFQKLYNRYDLSGDFGIGYTNKNEEFYFDLEDYDLIKEYCWNMKDEGYISTSDGNHKELKLHILILGKKNGYVIDHKNGIKHDCRKSKMRFVTKSQNAMNRVNLPNSTSGVQGITFSKEHNKWRSRITFEGKVIHLGYYEKLEDAIFVRKEAQKKYFGEYNPDEREI